MSESSLLLKTAAAADNNLERTASQPRMEAWTAELDCIPNAHFHSQSTLKWTGGWRQFCSAFTQWPSSPGGGQLVTGLLQTASGGTHDGILFMPKLKMPSTWTDATEVGLHLAFSLACSLSLFLFKIFIEQSMHPSPPPAV